MCGLSQAVQTGIGGDVRVDVDALLYCHSFLRISGLMRTVYAVGFVEWGETNYFRVLEKGYILMF